MMTLMLGFGLLIGVGVHRDVPVGRHSVVHLVGVDQHELLRADVDAVHVLDPARAVDSHPVDCDTVSAAEIFDHDRIRANVNHGVLSRHQSIGQSEIAGRAPTDGEFPERHLHVGRLISQSKSWHPSS